MISLTGKDAISAAKSQSCWWNIVAPKVDLGKKSENCIHMEITKVKDMDAYAYAGDTRRSADKPCHKGNAPLTTGMTYHYTASEGNLVTALPVAGSTDSEFEIKFWIGPTPPEGVYSTTPKPSNTGLLVVIIIAVVMIVVLAGVMMKMRMDAKK